MYANNDEERDVNMYSPGICTSQPYPRDSGKSAPPKPPNAHKFNLGAFMRAVCLVLVCTLFSAAAAYVVIDFRIDTGDFGAVNQVVLGSQPTPAPQSGDNAASLISLPEGEVSAQDIYDMALTQVVGINTVPPDSGGGFGMQASAMSVTGSGFIVSSDGYILTNYHVIEIAHNMNIPISVVLYDGSSYDAKVVGFDEGSDVAVLKIEATGLVPSLIGNSDGLRVGQKVYAVGNPFGDLVYTMTDGIVSALDRVVTVDGRTIGTFQFSAAVNSGNSGGPVYNASGEVIGIVTAKVIRGNVEGIGFAIPINDAIDIASDLIEHGYIAGRPYLGITVRTVTDANADYFGWVVGAYIRDVYPNSAAERAGIKVDDIITAINGEKVDSVISLRHELRKFNAGETTTITIWRGGETIDLTITFDEDSEAGKPDRAPVPTPDSPDPFEQTP